LRRSSTASEDSSLGSIWPRFLPHCLHQARVGRSSRRLIRPDFNRWRDRQYPPGKACSSHRLTLLIGLGSGPAAGRTDWALAAKGHAPGCRPAGALAIGFPKTPSFERYLTIGCAPTTKPSSSLPLTAVTGRAIKAAGSGSEARVPEDLFEGVRLRPPAPCGAAGRR